jgi:UDP-N-acetylglucosamine--N-acetylmuramyl-(pentapeptide) pyrophosphoryl-undecaprenol N-acetylglucosamine transferase|tara:strand:- start:41972 stop:43066 length:1095 start_codon:yes stop_codon:yes gene_type:complete
VKQTKFLLSGGGTCGHIFPAISIADELCNKFPSSEILFVGSSYRMEMQKIPESGYKIKGLWISGIKRKIHLSNLLIPFKIVSSLIKSFFIINKFKPDFVIGTGGFASGPLVFVASKLKIPTLIQEQNSYPGLTNKILSKTVDFICVAYSSMDKYFPKSKIVFTGNPIRKEIRNPSKSKNESLEQFKMSTSKKTLLVLGGSLGAQKINNFISHNIDLFKSMQIQIIWQCGKIYYNQYKKHNSVEVNVQSFIKDMNSAYSAADIIVSRSGACVISELCIIGKPVIFIPSPNLAEDHQTKNALFIKQNNAAEMVEEKHLEKDFFDVLKNLVSNNEYANELSRKIKVLEKPNATNDIVELIEKVLRDV